YAHFARPIRRTFAGSFAMIASSRSRVGAMFFGLAIVAASWFAFGRGSSETAAQAPSQPPGAVPIAPAAPPAAKPDDRAADRAAVLAAIESLTKTFGACDAKALAAHWTSEGEYIGTDGQSVRGRTELEKAYTGCFAKGNEQRVEF